MTTRKRGRPAFRKTPALAKRVEELTSGGMSQGAIAKVLRCDSDTLRKHFGDELDNGIQRRRAEVISLLFKSARGGNVTAQKKLEEMTGRAAVEDEFNGDRAPAPASPKPKKVGKKESESAQATSMVEDQDWGADIAASLGGAHKTLQ
ncbi:hypothetical protein [Methylosinus sporium]|uniref:Helix-turn-helix domain-containing protein n=1 Tax=Methylosinus sporium TaxID=428 RepID=A0A2U1SSU5_METSR|nr:hypothetical protein [Methylosinus sporium]PWB94672.1 hypothetical protein C5689_06305 [Methylosinus sporium]